MGRRHYPKPVVVVPVIRVVVVANRRAGVPTILELDIGLFQMAGFVWRDSGGGDGLVEIERRRLHALRQHETLRLGKLHRCGDQPFQQVEGLAENGGLLHVHLNALSRLSESEAEIQKNE